VPVSADTQLLSKHISDELCCRKWNIMNTSYIRDIKHAGRGACKNKRKLSPRAYSYTQN
jgi:hypothetical protein